MNVAIFGGSFDPVHLGHVDIVNSALDELDIDKIIIVPTFLNPFKRTFLASPEVRFSWLKEIFKNTPNVEVSNFEIMQHSPTPTIKTVEYFQRSLSPSNIYLIIGADNIPSLHLWQDYKKLKRLVTFVVAARKGFEIPGDYIQLNINVDISSTALRTKIDKRFLPEEIAEKIVNHYSF